MSNSTLFSGIAAFFPWVALKEPITLGPTLRLFPYSVGELPGDLPHATQLDLDGILAAYSNRPNARVPAATILEVDSWQTGLDDDNVRSRLFRARTAIGFAALASRRLFGHLDYCCYDAFTLIVQRYRIGDTGKFSFGTRRRDGGTRHLWGSDEFAFQRPLHVDSRARMEFDHRLAQSLFELPVSASAQMFEAISEFNSANTDSPDVPEHVEVVMMKSAFEWLLNIKENSKDFVRALQARLPLVDREPTQSGPLEDAWKTRFQKAQRPLDAWAQEFCDLRGASAHGTARKAPRFVWPSHTHLAFASALFPLLVKKQLADSGNGLLSTFEAEKLRRIDSYLMHDPFTHDPIESSEPNPWSELDQQGLLLALASKIYPQPAGEG